MAVGFPAKVTYANGDVFSASDINDTNGTINLINPSAKGDLFAGSAANTYTKLTVGGNTAPLVADSTASTGLRWDNSAWTAYTPTWTSSGTAPSLGNGVLEGFYKQRGKIVNGYIRFVAGSTTTYGTGSYSLSIPVDAKNGGTGNYGLAGIIGSGWYIDVSAGIFFNINCDTYDSANKIAFRLFIATGTYTTLATIGATSPVAWANGDSLLITYEYEAA